MSYKKQHFESALNALMRPASPWRKSEEERADMTIACHDGDDIPRTKEAGTTKKVNGLDVQVMHNGLLVRQDGYQGVWQTRTIKELKGIHEPQEEKVFYEVLKRVDDNSVMMELGAWWAYYSMWFVKHGKHNRAICCEPDPDNLQLGKDNAALNKLREGTDIQFYAAAAGSNDGQQINFETLAGPTARVPIRTVDSIIAEQKLARLEILHMDIQGIELDALHGALKSIDTGKIRFLFVSTHHYSISNDPIMHKKCTDLIKKHGGTVIASHSVLESCSGDGLIVASFDKRDKDFKVDVTLQPSNDSLFRSHEEDLSVLWKDHERFLKYTSMLEQKTDQLQVKVENLTDRYAELNQLVSEITPLKKHIKRQVGTRVKRIPGIHKA